MMSSASSSTLITADSALAMAKSPVWSGASIAAAGYHPPPDPSGRVIRALGPTGWYCPRRELWVVHSQRRSGRRVSGAPSRTA